MTSLIFRDESTFAALFRLQSARFLVTRPDRYFPFYRDLVIWWPPSTFLSIKSLVLCHQTSGCKIGQNKGKPAGKKNVIFRALSKLVTPLTCMVLGKLDQLCFGVPEEQIKKGEVPRHHVLRMPEQTKKAILKCVFLQK